MADSLEYKLVVADNGSVTLKKFSGELDKTQRKVEGTGKSFGGMAMAAKGLLGVLAVGKLVSWGNQIMKNNDLQVDLAASLGITTKSLAGFSYAAHFNGATAEGFAKSTKILTKNLADAAKGTGEAKDYFKVFGIEVQNADGTLKKTDDVI